MDTEVYSNTGGQSSKSYSRWVLSLSLPLQVSVYVRKDLGMIATTYGYVYVAQIAMGADQAQTLKAIREAVKLTPVRHWLSLTLRVSTTV